MPYEHRLEILLDDERHRRISSIARDRASQFETLVREAIGRFAGDISSGVEVGGAQHHRRPEGSTMLADLDLLLTSVFCTADVLGR